MKAKKTAVLCAALGMLSLFATGCNDSVQTGEELVVPRENQEALNGQDSEEGEDEKSGSGDGIARQVQAPESYSWEGESGSISVKVNAPVVIPQADGFKSYQVTSRVFTQEDYDKVNQVLLKEAQLWERDYEKMEASNGFTREEIEERLAQLKKQKAAYEAGKGAESNIVYAREKTYDELIAEWEERWEKAPDTAEIKEVWINVSYNEGSEENWQHGYATVDGQDYFVSLDNGLSAEWRWIDFEVRKDNAKSSFLPAGRDAQIGNPGISIETVRQEAQKLAEDMGFTDFAIAGEEYVQSYAGNETDDGPAVDRTGYSIHFTRTIDGIPVTYTHSEGTSVETGVAASWPYETLDIIFDEEGVAGFIWKNPYQMEKISDDYVFLFPFSDIQNIFQEMIFKKYGDFFGDLDIKAEFQIDEVRLGYMRTMEKGNFTEGMMVPVWDFFGRETLTYEDMGETYTESGPYASWLTINAMDGTIIDREFGY